jgi:hypothetical protein
MCFRLTSPHVTGYLVGRHVTRRRSDSLMYDVADMCETVEKISSRQAGGQRVRFDAQPICREDRPHRQSVAENVH